MGIYSNYQASTAVRGGVSRDVAPAQKGASRCSINVPRKRQQITPRALRLHAAPRSAHAEGLREGARPKRALHLLQNKQEGKQTYLLLLQMQQFHCAYFSARVTT